MGSLTQWLDFLLDNKKQLKTVSEKTCVIYPGAPWMGHTEGTGQDWEHTEYYLHRSNVDGTHRRNRTRKATLISVKMIAGSSADNDETSHFQFLHALRAVETYILTYLSTTIVKPFAEEEMMHSEMQ